MKVNKSKWASKNPDKNFEANEVYAMPQPCEADLGDNGYPNDIPNTKTRPIRGTGAAKQGIKYSKNSQ
jgi:hypothetical protein